MVAYWTLWFADRGSVASESATYYYDFENAFPLADGLLTVAVLLTAWRLWCGDRGALLWGLLAAGGGVYLFGLDILFDLEHGIWGRGAGGAIELVINLLTVSASCGFATWLWRHRQALEEPSG